MCSHTGTWQAIFDLVVATAVVTNAAMIVFTMNLIDGFSTYRRFWIFIGFQWVVFAVQYVIRELIPDIPFEVCLLYAIYYLCCIVYDTCMYVVYVYYLIHLYIKQVLNSTHTRIHPYILFEAFCTVFILIFINLHIHAIIHSYTIIRMYMSGRDPSPARRIYERQTNQTNSNRERRRLT